MTFDFRGGAAKPPTLHDSPWPPLRSMPDGTPCWCLSQDEPHEGWIHAPACIARRVDRVLVIDDERVFRFPATYARSVAEAMPYLFRRLGWEEVWWDYDLGGEETTRDLAYQISYAGQYGTPPPIGRIVIHTANPVGLDFLRGVLGGVYAKVEVVDAAPWVEGVRGIHPGAT